MMMHSQLGGRRSISGSTIRRKIQASGNKLSALPAAFAGMQTLTRVSLGTNQFEAMPPALNQLSKLECLDFSRNQIVKIEPVHFAFKALQRLDLSYCKLAGLDAFQLERTALLFVSAHSIPTPGLGPV